LFGSFKPLLMIHAAIYGYMLVASDNLFLLSAIVYYDNWCCVVNSANYYIISLKALRA
jgi:hypothetical protein